MLSATSLLAASAPAANGVFSFDRLRVGGATGAETYMFTAGNVVYPEGGADTGRYYRFVVADSSGATRLTTPCRPATQFNTSDNTYTLSANDPLSGSAGWKYTLNQYTSSTCTGTPGKTASKTFYVARATAYADSTLTTTKSAFRPGDTAYVLVRGAKPSTSNWSNTWLFPNGTVVCANTLNNDRPDADATGLLPNTWLQYRPNTTATGSNWNRETNYDVKPCVNFASSNEGAWVLRMTLNATNTVDLPVFSVDATAPPAPTIGSNPPNPSGSSSASFTFSDTDATATLLCRVDAAAFATCTSPASYSGLTNGSHTFQVKARDAAGNESAVASYTWTVDTIPPAAPSITSKPQSPTNTTSATFAFSGEAGATFTCQLDGSAFSTCSSPKSYSNLVEGQHSFAVKATDAAGNTGPAASYSWTIDVTAPAAPTITSFPPNPTGSTDATFAFSGESGATFTCRLDGAAFAVCASPASYSGLTEGSHSFDVRARDAAGNDGSPATYSWLISLPPAVTLTQPAQGALTNDATPTFAGVGGIDIGDSPNVTVKVYAGTVAQGTPVEALVAQVGFTGAYSVDASPPLGDGTYTAQAQQSDAVGTGFSSATTFTVDSTPPAPPSIDTYPPVLSTSRSAAFSFSGEPGATFKCRLDAAAFAVCTSPASYSGLADGPHSFDVKATDAAGNESTVATFSWTIDATPPPAPTIGSSPPNPTNSTSASFGFSDTDATATLLCKLDGATFASCTSPAAYSNLADGSHTFQVKARDAAGNESAPASYTWTVDTTAPPPPTIGSSPPNPTNSTSASFGFSDTDATATLLCKLDGATFASCTSPAAYSSLADGSHTFQVKARDAAGNDSTAASYTWTVDTTPPAPPSIDSHPPSLSTSRSAAFSFSGEAGATFKCRLDAAAFAPCTSPTSYSGLADGPHSFDVKAIDAAGNESTLATFSWTIDATGPPTPTINSSPPDPSNSAAATFGFSDADGSATLLCKLDTAAFANCTSPTSYSSLADGSHTFQVKASDAAGNESAAASYTWTIDTTAPPAPSINSHPPALSVSRAAAFSFSGEAGATFKCRLDGDPFAGCSSPANYSGLADGPHSFDVKATDAVGNESTAATFSWTIDATPPPVPTIGSHPSDPSNSSSASIGFSDTEASATLLCRLDSAAFASCTSPAAYSGLADGSHTFQVKARDAAGNDSTPANFTWTVDTSPPPAPSIVTKPSDPTNQTVATFDFTGEAGAEFECSLDGAPFSSECESPVGYLNLTEGQHTFAVKAEDAAGNQGAAATYAWNIDLTPPPTPSIDTFPPNPTSSSSATFTFSTEPGATFTCRLDGAAFTACTSPKLYTALADGSHTFDVKATDAAGNVSSPATYTWLISAPPVVMLTQPGQGTSTNDATPLFAGVAGTDVGDDPNVAVKVYSGFVAQGTPVETLIAQVDFTGAYSVEASPALADGTYTAQAQQSDAGGTGFSSANTFSIDATPPAAPSIDSHPPAVTNSRSATLAFSDETGATFKCRLDGAPFAACTSPVNYSGLADGTHSFDVKATDAAGNEGAVATFSWSVDATAPVITLTSPANGSSSANPRPTFSGVAGSASGDSQTVTVKVFSGGDVNGTLVQTLTTTAQAGGAYSVPASADLAQGTYTARAQQADSAGNLGLSSANTFIIGTNYRSVILSDNPRAYWRLGETSGTVAADQMGANPGTYTNGVVLGQVGALIGDADTGVQLDGVDDYVVAPDSNSLDITGAVTVEAWVQRTKNAAFQVIVGKPGNGQSKFENYALWFNTSNGVTAYFGNGTTFASATTPALDTNWHHVAATYDNATVRVYVDGTQRASSSSTVQLTANTQPLNLGRAQGTTAYSLGGKLDEVAIYPTVLSAARIQAHYDAARRTDTVAPAVTLTAPSNGLATTDSTPTLAGRAGNDVGDSQTVTVKVYSGGTPTGTPVRQMIATAQIDSSYSVDASPALPDGLYTAQTEQTDTNGNVGKSTANTFTVDTTAPTPTLVAPANGSLKNPPPTFTGQGGTASGDSSQVTVKVYTGPDTTGTLVRTLTTSLSSGSFSVDASPPLTNGTYTAQVEQVDLAGNVGRSAANTFTITDQDMTPPVVTLTQPLAGSRTTQTTPLFAGTGGTSFGDSTTVTVKVYAGSAPVGTPVQTLTTTRDSFGAFSVNSSPLLEGTYTARAEQSDLGGNLGQSVAVTFAVDLTGPTISLTAPANGSSSGNQTPSFQGTAGTAAGDSTTVTVKVWSGPTPTGTPIQTLSTTAGGGGIYSVLASQPLAQGTYTARAEQSDSAGNTGQSTANTFTVNPSASVTVLAAGDISSPSCDPSFSGAFATAAILNQNPNATVVTLGDTGYDHGQPSDFACYNQSWGAAKARTIPMIGDHEYDLVSGGTAPGMGFINYFHDQLAPLGANALDPSKLYYSYDLGAWHVVVLNSSCYFQVAPNCDTEAQEHWFENDLNAHPTDCTMVLWHATRWSSGSIHGDYFPTQQFWETAYDHGVELVMSGNDHDYERFARQDAAGNADPQYGVRQFVVGSGGYSHYDFGATVPNSQVRNNDTYGVLKLTLRQSDFDWQFLPEAGHSFTDSGTDQCHTAPPAPPPGSPVVRSSSSASANHPSASISLAKPVGAAQGDLLLAIVSHQSGSSSNMTPPSGWTAVPNADYSDANNARIRAWYKFAGASEPSSYTFTINSSQAIAGGMLAITGASGTPINAALGQVTATNTLFLTAPSITTTAPKTLLVYGGAINTPLFITPPAFMHEQFDVGTSGPYNVETEVATQQLATTGATGARTAYVSDSGARGPAFLIAIAAP